MKRTTSDNMVGTVQQASSGGFRRQTQSLQFPMVDMFLPQGFQLKNSHNEILQSYVSRVYLGLLSSQ